MTICCARNVADIVRSAAETDILDMSGRRLSDGALSDRRCNIQDS
jgi:hypothetical protein